MLFGAGALSDQATLLGWGASFGPRTTNGEWWRLLTATFVHSGMIALLVNVAGLAQAGLVTERLAGPVAFVTVYVSAGLAASLVTLSSHPMSVSFGASGAVFGVYGLLLATSMWSRFNRSDDHDSAEGGEEPRSSRRDIRPVPHGERRHGRRR